MRVTSFAAATALTAALAAAAPAFAVDTAGRVDLSYSNTRWDWTGSVDDNTDVAVGGAFASTFGNGWGVQVDGRADRYQWQEDAAPDSVGFAAVHAFKRGDGYAVGAFAGQTFFYGATGVMAGVEGQVDLPKATLSASAGKAEFDGSRSDYGLWDAQVAGRWFFTDNFAVGGAVGYVDWDDARREITGWNAGLDAEYRPFAAAPVSVFAAARHDDNDYALYDYSSDTLTVGVRLDFGAATLRERHRRGPSLAGAQALGDHLLHY